MHKLQRATPLLPLPRFSALFDQTQGVELIRRERNQEATTKGKKNFYIYTIALNRLKVGNSIESNELQSTLSSLHLHTIQFVCINIFLI